MGTNQSDDPLFRLTGLSTEDLADTLAKNPRAYMALKGAVAEKHLCLYLESLLKNGKIKAFRCGIGDFEKDFYVEIAGSRSPIVIECKNVQVIHAGTLANKREYLDFLKRNQYLSIEEYKVLLPRSKASFEDASATELSDAFKRLPLDLRESGLPRYAFSRKICKVDSAPLLSAKNCESYLHLFEEHPITIDFQRTRNSRDDGDTDNKANRFYKVGELDIVAACLFSRTLEWNFIFCKAKNLERHSKYRDRYSNSVQINPKDWKADLLDALG